MTAMGSQCETQRGPSEKWPVSLSSCTGRLQLFAEIHWGWEGLHAHQRLLNRESSSGAQALQG